MGHAIICDGSVAREERHPHPMRLGLDEHPVCCLAVLAAGLRPREGVAGVVTEVASAWLCVSDRLHREHCAYRRGTVTLLLHRAPLSSLFQFRYSCFHIEPQNLHCP
jgi:hypothetical protein